MAAAATGGLPEPSISVKPLNTFTSAASGATRIVNPAIMCRNILRPYYHCWSLQRHPRRYKLWPDSLVRGRPPGWPFGGRAMHSSSEERVQGDPRGPGGTRADREGPAPQFM